MTDDKKPGDGFIEVEGCDALGEIGGGLYTSDETALIRADQVAAVVPCDNGVHRINLVAGGQLFTSCDAKTVRELINEAVTPPPPSVF